MVINKGQTWLLLHLKMRAYSNMSILHRKQSLLCLLDSGWYCTSWAKTRVLHISVMFFLCTVVLPGLAWLLISQTPVIFLCQFHFTYVQDKPRLLECQIDELMECQFLGFSCRDLWRIQYWYQLGISKDNFAALLYTKCLVSFPRIPIPETKKSPIRGFFFFFRAQKHSCSKSRFFLWQKYDLLFRSLHSNDIANLAVFFQPQRGQCGRTCIQVLLSWCLLLPTISLSIVPLWYLFCVCDTHCIEQGVRWEDSTNTRLNLQLQVRNFCSWNFCQWKDACGNSLMLLIFYLSYNIFITYLLFHLLYSIYFRYIYFFTVNLAHSLFFFLLSRFFC